MDRSIRFTWLKIKFLEEIASKFNFFILRFNLGG